MSDECCGGPAELKPIQFETTEAPGLFAQRDVQLAAAAAALLLASVLAARFGAGVASEALAAAALVAGGSTFVPGALRDLVRRRIGVATLMTVGGAGAVLLGQLFEAAMLAVLFSASEGLESSPSPGPAAGCARCWPWSPTGSPSSGTART